MSKNASFSLTSLFVGVFAVLAAALPFSAPDAAADGDTITVCASGCDYTSFTAATQHGGLFNDTIRIATGFVFDENAEDEEVWLPDDIQLTCDEGVTFGDADQDAILLWTGSRNTIHHCTFENVSFDASFREDVEISDNVFSPDAKSRVTLTETGDFLVARNQGIQKLQVQGAFNGFVEDNAFECRFAEGCLALVNDTPHDISVTGNTFINKDGTHAGDIVYFGKGTDITFTDNVIGADLMNDMYMTMVTVEQGDVYIARNLFLTPQKPPNANGATWGLNFRVGEGNATVVAENNTFYDAYGGPLIAGDAALGVFDNNANDASVIDVTFRRNLVYRAASPNYAGAAVTISRDNGGDPATLNLTVEHNGFYGYTDDVFDDIGLLTSLSSTNIHSDPLFRTENADPDDDYVPSPISRYWDVDGTLDIGAFGGDAGAADRVTAYLVDDDCAVDYVTCFTNEAANLRHAVTTGDVVTVAAGTYGAVQLDFPATDVTFTGAGADTVFDAAGAGSAFAIENVSSSQFSDFSVKNADADVSETTTYLLSHAMFSFNGNDYNTTAAVTGYDNMAMFFTGPSCATMIVYADDTDVTAAVMADPTDDINVVLADVAGGYARLTAFIPNRFASDVTEFLAYVADCPGSPPVTIDMFLNSVFESDGVEYAYNAGAVDSAGVTLMSGLTSPPSLTRIHDVSISDDVGGLLLRDADDNAFENVVVSDNGIGLFLDDVSADNVFTGLTFNDNDTDLVSVTAADNRLISPDFDLGKVLVDGAGDVEVHHTFRVSTTRTSPSGPLSGANVEIRDASNAVILTTTTDADGLTSFFGPTLVTVLSQGGPYTAAAGGIQPFTVKATKSGFNGATLTTEIDASETTVPLVLPKSSSGGGGGGGGGDGGSALIAPVLSTPAPTASTSYGAAPAMASALTINGDKSIPAAEGTPRCTSNTLIKLPSDNNPLTQEDSTVYYCGADGKRYVFPDVGTYASWYDDYSGVIEVPAETLAAIPIGGSVTYRPGKRLVKLQTDPKTYAVDKNGVLRLVVDEETARLLYGPNWARFVSDLSDAFFASYRIGAPITKELAIAGDFEVEEDTDVPTTTACAAASPFAMPLSVGSTHPEVRQLQTVLQCLGYFPADVAVNGVFGPTTGAAVRAFQTANDLEPLGSVGPGTRAALNALKQNP